MFDGLYLERNQKKIKAIIDHFGYPFFHGKKVLDLGCGHGDVGAAFFRLGSVVTAVDARNEHLKITAKKYPGIKIVRADLDKEWTFNNFDIVLNLDLLCHMKNYENHLRNACHSASFLILETAVADSNDPGFCSVISENKEVYDWSFNGFSSRPSAANIEKIFVECGMEFKRIDNSKLNTGTMTYDWVPTNNSACDINKRRFWIASRVQPVAKTQQVLPMVHNPAHLSPGMVLTPAMTISAPILPANTSFIDSRTAPQFIPNNMPFIPGNNGNKLIGENKFVIVIPSYKNSRWCEKNIISAINQNYDKYRIIFVDDCSSDNTFDLVKTIVNASGKSDKITLIKNTTRIGAMANLYNMIHSCEDDEIILTLDGDDWFPNEQVLSKLDKIYSDTNIWMTYGQYKNHPDGQFGIAQQYPDHIINSNLFRQHVWSASHLRTFYAWLFKKIKKEDFMYQGNFLQMTWDFAMMFPMLEMSGHHSKFISDILYVYNMENPINDHKVNQKLQQDLDRYLRAAPKYQKIDPPEIKKPNVGLLIIATAKYSKFIQGFISSADKYFLNNTCNVSYYVFSDNNNQIQSSRIINNIIIPHRPFPFASMDRFKHFINNKEILNKEDYLFYCDVDSLFVDNISKEILGDLVGVRHCGYYKSAGPYETNSRSALYANPSSYKYYFGGGFSGGKREKYLALSQWCSDAIDKDIAAGIMPIWHDETAINRYFADHAPSIALSPSYHYPQSNINRYKEKWAPDTFNPKILLLDKDHHSVRS